MPEARAQGRGKKSAGSVAVSEPLVATSLLSQAGARPSRSVHAETLGESFPPASCRAVRASETFAPREQLLCAERSLDGLEAWSSP